MTPLPARRIWCDVIAVQWLTVSWYPASMADVVIDRRVDIFSCGCVAILLFVVTCDLKWNQCCAALLPIIENLLIMTVHVVYCMYPLPDVHFQQVSSNSAVIWVPAAADVIDARSSPVHVLFCSLSSSARIFCSTLIPSRRPDALITVVVSTRRSWTHWHSSYRIASSRITCFPTDRSSPLLNPSLESVLDLVIFHSSATSFTSI